MSKHEHCGSGCKHPSLKFCVTCKVPYCLQCGKEWNENTGWTIRSGGTLDKLQPFLKTTAGGYVQETTSTTVPDNLCKHGK